MDFQDDDLTHFETHGAKPLPSSVEQGLGLWPGRRWQGVEGTEQAMREMDNLQLDPLQIIARSHDISYIAVSSQIRPTSLDTPVLPHIIRNIEFDLILSFVVITGKKPKTRAITRVLRSRMIEV